MKSVLLGGLKVFLINDGGFPLSAPGGRAKFFKAGTSTPETVYSDIDLTEGTALGPVVYTDSLGALPAIWLKTDRLYKVQVEQKLPGSPETWSLLWEIDNVGYIDPHETEEPGEAPISVNSIAALKQVDHSEHAFVMVSGYYASGDWGEPSVFVYDTESTLRADDGSVVRPNDVDPGNAGRWLQVFEGDVLDVRKFGALPDMTENADVTAQVVNAVNYSQRNSTRSRPLTIAFVAPGKYEFAGDFDFTDYADFVDLSDNTHHPINWYIAGDVVFKGSNSAFTLSKNTVCMAREQLVEGVGVTLSVEGGGAIEVDPAWWGAGPCSVSDCFVKCHSETDNNKHFTRCTIESDRMLGGIVELESMTFKEEWFKSSYAWSQLILTNTLVSVHDCFSANSYVAIKNARGETDIGDLGEQTLFNVTLNGVVVENAQFSNVTLNGACELHNISGTIKITAGTTTINAVDCWLECADTTAPVIDRIELRRGEVKGLLPLTILGNALFDGVSLNIDLVVSCEGPVFKNCEINNDVKQNAVSNEYKFLFIGCVFNAHHIMQGAGTDIVVNGTWQNNTSTVDNPVYVDASTLASLKQNEYQHGYVYSGNTGKFLRTEVIAYFDFSIYRDIPAPILSLLSDGEFAYVEGFNVPVSAASVYSGVCVKIPSIEYTMFGLGVAGGQLHKVSFNLMIKGTTGLTASNAMDNPYQFKETVCEVDAVNLPSNRKVNLNMFSGFHRKMMQKSTNTDNESVTSAVAAFHFKSTRKS